ncbi:MAG: molybdenum cofactor sulfurase [Elusimicrobia bacterium GWA2_69_24]|nr:MAG: molybdenum cofactor sulfurase [Elusimicrobia bacterium GWA2_69_24]HBL18526.1 MOSC domain-containing protein [Elusimicrobiota bacterium]
MTGSVVAVCRSDRKGTAKTSIPSGLLVAGEGMRGDAHAGPGDRQLSLLASESVDTMRAKGLSVGPGSFGENLTTRGVLPADLAPGRRLRIGRTAEVEVTIIGKTCHTPCAIYRQAGDCVMPRDGVFVRVLSGGEVRPGDAIELLAPAAPAS